MPAATDDGLRRQRTTPRESLQRPVDLARRRRRVDRLQHRAERGRFGELAVASHRPHRGDRVAVLRNQFDVVRPRPCDRRQRNRRHRHNHLRFHLLIYLSFLRGPSAQQNLAIPLFTFTSNLHLVTFTPPTRAECGTTSPAPPGARWSRRSCPFRLPTRRPWCSTRRLLRYLRRAICHPCRVPAK